MNRRRICTTSSLSRAGFAALLLALAASAFAQQVVQAKPAPTTAKATATTAQPAAPAATPFTEAELASLMAPIALYPDNVIGQILMAATYPIEVIEAHRWLQAHKDLKGEALYAEVQKQEWEDSVKSMVAAPDVLKMMDENLSWMQKVGDAFLAQQEDVFTMIQILREKAKKEGNLKSDDHMKVSTKPAPAEATATATATTTVITEEKPPQIIVIESSNPETIYVPTYAPASMYGYWGYPSYPPYYWPPPVGYPGSGFWWGVGVGIAVGGGWGDCCWGGGDVDIDWNGGDINIGGDRTNIGSGNRVEHRGDRTTTRTGDRAAATNRSGQSGKWSHNPEHRKGVSYRDNASATKYDRASKGSGSRESFRGRTGEGGTGSRPSAGTREAGSGSRPSAGTRDVGSGSGTRPSAGSREAGSGSRPSAGTRDVGSGSSTRPSAGTRDTGSRPSAGTSSRSSGSRGSSGSSYGGSSRGSSGAFGGMSSGSRAGSYGSRGGMSRGGGGGGRGGGGGGRRW